MEVYNSEQDQVEALKAWWDKNGKLVIVGVIALLLGVFGWRSWQDRQLQTAESASVAYYQMLELAGRDSASAMEIGRHIVGEFSNTVYAPMASMALARLAVEQGELSMAEAQLRVVAQQGRLPELQIVARLRLAQVLFAQGQDTQALAQLQGDAGTLQSAFDELRGDILLSQGEQAQARAAYASALERSVGQQERQSVLEMKLNDLAEGSVE